MYNSFVTETRRKVLKVAKIKDANFGCKDEGNEVISQSVSCNVCDVVYDGICDVVCDGLKVAPEAWLCGCWFVCVCVCDGVFDGVCDVVCDVMSDGVVMLWCGCW